MATEDMESEKDVEVEAETMADATSESIVEETSDVGNSSEIRNRMVGLLFSN